MKECIDVSLRDAPFDPAPFRQELEALKQQYAEAQQKIEMGYESLLAKARAGYEADRFRIVVRDWPMPPPMLSGISSFKSAWW